MKTTFRWFLIFSLLLFSGILSCYRDITPLDPQIKIELSPQEIQLLSATNSFGFNLFKSIAADEEGKNIFISPLSVSMALGMTLNGADGETRLAMQKTLELQGLSQEEINAAYKDLILLLTHIDPRVAFEIANSIWYKNGLPIHPDFVSLNQKFFGALVQALDFNDPGSVDVINNWVNESTNGKIRKILDGINPDDVMFLINAIYFKGDWKYQFDKAKTKKDDFKLPDGTLAPCFLMQQRAKFSYAEDDLLQVIDLPYGNGFFSMTIFLPKPIMPLDSLIENFTSVMFSYYLDRLATREVLLEMPRFKFEYEKKLNDVLTDLGMGIAFDKFHADFSRMVTRPMQLYLNFVKHKTFVKVDEEGTEAAAVTSVGVGVTRAYPKVAVMRVDHPFVFVIRENVSNSLIFMGKIVKPEWSE